MNQEEQHIIETDLLNLIAVVTAWKNEGFRLVAITATQMGNRHELSYSFDKDYQFLTHRMTLPEGDALPSITEIYPSGFVYENELHDIFKITVVSKSAASLDVHPRKLITFPFAFNSKYGARTCQNK